MGLLFSASHFYSSRCVQLTQASEPSSVHAQKDRSHDPLKKTQQKPTPSPKEIKRARSSARDHL